MDVWMDGWMWIGGCFYAWMDGWMDGWMGGLVKVCVFFTLNRSFHPSTSSTTSVRADSSRY